MMPFQITTNLPCRCGKFGTELLLRSGFVARSVRARVANPVKSALRPASSGNEIHGPVRTKRQIGHVQGASLQKHLGHTGISCAPLDHMDGQNPPKGPIQNEKGIPIGGRKTTPVAKFNRGRRTLSDMCG